MDLQNVDLFKGGLYNLYGISQEQFCWDIRQEPAVIDAFATIWQTRDLLVSFGTWMIQLTEFQLSYD